MGSSCSVMIVKDDDSEHSYSSSALSSGPIQKIDMFGSSVRKVLANGQIETEHVNSDLGIGTGAKVFDDSNLDFNVSVSSPTYKGNPYLFFGIVDGFGPMSHKMVITAQDILQNELTAAVKQCPEKFQESKAAETVLIETFETLQRELEDKKFDPKGRSGLCALIIHFDGVNTITCCNVGNCAAAVLQCEKEPERKFWLTKLSPVHEWEKRKSERRRGEEMGCVIKKTNIDNVGFIGSEAIWYGPDHPKAGTQAPGLTASRALGCPEYKDAGIISTPETKITKISPKAKSIIVGSRGLWTVMNDDEILQFARNSQKSRKSNNYLNAQALAEAIRDAATEKWNSVYTEENVQVQCFSPSLYLSKTSKYLDTATVGRS